MADKVLKPNSYADYKGVKHNEFFKNDKFSGDESVEEIEETILKENSIIEFYDFKNNTISKPFEKVKNAASFLNALMTPIATDQYGTRRVRQFATRFVDSKLPQTKAATHGRSLVDIFMVCKGVAPNITLREILLEYVKIGQFGICRDIRKRLINTQNYSNTKYTSDVNTLDEFNKTMYQWFDALGIEYKSLNPNGKLRLKMGSPDSGMGSSLIYVDKITDTEIAAAKKQGYDVIIKKY